MTLHEVDPIEWVRGNPQMFFIGGAASALRMLPYLVNDVTELGGGECRILRCDGWWFVSSENDWLKDRLSVPELFNRVVPAPQHGEHSMRAEIIINAYADDVFAVSEGKEWAIKGRTPDRRCLERIEASATAIVAFRLSEDH